MRISDTVLKAVAFLGVRMHPGIRNSALMYKGSGFVVSVIEQGVTFYYIVTADHVARCLMASPEPMARMNDIDGNPFETQLRWVPEVVAEKHGTPKDFWQRHPDKSVDLAIHSFKPWDHSVELAPGERPKQRGIGHAPVEMLVDDSMLGPDGIGVGDEVFVVGLFSFVRGERSNSPIVRVGNLAMIPHEPVKAHRNYGLMEAYLVEARSIGGISGAPVFVRETVSLEPLSGPYQRFDQRLPQFHASGKFYVLGVAQGHWDAAADEANAVEPLAVDAKSGATGVNIGIAIVTPAKKIRDILYGEFFSEERARVAKSLTSRELRGRFPPS